MYRDLLYNLYVRLNWNVINVTDRVFGPDAITEEVYEVAAKPVVKAAMEGVNGMRSRKYY